MRTDCYTWQDFTHSWKWMLMRAADLILPYTGLKVSLSSVTFWFLFLNTYMFSSLRFFLYLAVVFRNSTPSHSCWVAWYFWVQIVNDMCLLRGLLRPHKIVLQSKKEMPFWDFAVMSRSCSVSSKELCKLVGFDPLQN